MWKGTGRQPNTYGPLFLSTDFVGTGVAQLQLCLGPEQRSCPCSPEQYGLYTPPSHREGEGKEGVQVHLESNWYLLSFLSGGFSFTFP